MRSELQSRARPEPPQSEALARAEVIGHRYAVERLWRNHPLGAVHVCRDLAGGPGGGLRVWVQRLRPELSEARVRAQLEQLGARAAHGAAEGWLPRACGVDSDGRPYLVYARRPGVPLAELERPLAFADVATVVEQIGERLAPAHAAGLAHGGLDLASVIVVRGADAKLRVTGLLGFGVIPALDLGSKGRKLPLLMTAAQAAPELVRGAAFGPSTDVYALGVLAWELFHGAPPFRGPTLRILDAHLHRAPPERALPADAAPGFAWALARMLAKHPGERLPDAAHVAAQLRGAALPDLSADLVTEPDLLAVADPPAPAPAPGSPTRGRDDADDEAQTRVFERVLDGPPVASPTTVPVAVRAPVEPSFDASVVGNFEPGPALEANASPGRARVVALACLAALLLLLLVGALAR